MVRSLPVVSAKETLAALQRAGFEIKRHHGSHVFLARSDRPGLYVCVPMHHGDLTPGTLNSILKQAGLTVEQFRELL